MTLHTRFLTGPTVKWRRLCLQLPPSRLRPHFVKATVRVHEYPDGQLAVFWGPHRLADYDAAGHQDFYNL